MWQKCKKTCDKCDPLPPSAPPPSSPTEVDCSGFNDKKCKIKINACEKNTKNMKKCKKSCTKDRKKKQKKKKCQKTCCELGFLVV